MGLWDICTFLFSHEWIDAFKRESIELYGTYRLNLIKLGSK